jgi:uncharacterized membrane protein
MASRVPTVPPHVEESIAAIAKLHAEHYGQAGAFQRLVSAATAMVARPRTLGLITLVIAIWVALNVTLIFSDVPPLDRFPFPFLSAAVSTVGLYLTAMILIAQRHDDELATRRDQLTLELAILSEQKSAKIIALLEEFRRNDPNQGDHRDELAEALAKPAETQVVLDAIEAAHAEPTEALAERPGSAQETDRDRAGWTPV